MSAQLEFSDADITLAQWRSREAAVRASRQGVGLARPEQVAGKSGLEIFRAMLRGELPAPPIGDTLDFALVEVDAGRVQFQGQPRFAHFNPMGTVHGGWIATLLDSAASCAVHTMLPPGKGYTTIEIKVNYVKALTERVPLVRAIGEVIHNGGRIGTAQATLVGPDGTLFAHATATCIVLDTR